MESDIVLKSTEHVPMSQILYFEKYLFLIYRQELGHLSEIKNMCNTIC